jgi:competence protein ComEC
LFDVSFQLSFLATLGVVYVAPGIERWLAFLPKWTQLHEPLSLTLGAQVFVLPILIYTSGVLSFTSVPVNIIIGPLVPLVMIFGFLAMILSMFGSIIAIPMVFLAGISASLIIWLVFLFAKIPFGAITISTLHPIVLALLYAVIVGIVFRKRFKLLLAGAS